MNYISSYRFSVQVLIYLIDLFLSGCCRPEFLLFFSTFIVLVSGTSLV